MYTHIIKQLLVLNHICILSVEYYIIIISNIVFIPGPGWAVAFGRDLR